MAGGYGTESGGGAGMMGTIGAVAGGMESMFNYLGEGDMRKYLEWLRNYNKSLAPMLQGELNNPAISQSQVMGMQPMIQKGMAPFMNKLAGNASARLGLDSGAAQGEIARGGHNQMQGILAQMLQRAMEMNANKRQNILGLQVGLGRMA